MRTVKIYFHRKDILNHYFNESFINSNLQMIDSFGDNWISFKDDVINNSEADSRNNILNFIKKTIDKSPLIEVLNCEILVNSESVFPTILHIHSNIIDQRTICEIIHVQ